MFIISHRGNLHGVNPKLENHPNYIDAAVDAGFYVEIDLRTLKVPYDKDDSEEFLMLGHDEPEHLVPPEYLQNDKFFIHCKNIAAVATCKRLGVKHFFFHANDDCTLTSSGYIWTYPDNRHELTTYSIPVVYHRKDPIWDYRALLKCAGLCTDDPFYYQSILEVSDPALYC